MREEKILLLQLILEDIRGNWGWGLEDRVNVALDLASELDLRPHIDRINEYNDRCLDGDNDGRFFRCHYENGGYEDMMELHCLESTIQDKSDWFKSQVGVLTYPDVRFDDWDKYESR